MAWAVERRTKAGRRVVHVQWREGPRVRSESVGSADKALVARALAKAEDRERRAANPASPAFGVATLLERFLAHLQVMNRAAGTLRFYRAKLAPLLHDWRDRALDDWTRPAFEEWVVARQAGEGDRPALSPASIAHTMAAARALIGWAGEVGYPLPDFVGTLRKPRVEVTAPVVLTAVQVEALLTAEAEPGIRAALALAALGGLRREELLRLRWQDVDLKAGTLLVRGKSRRERVVPVHPRLAAVLRETRPGVGFVIARHRHGAAMYPRLRAVYARAKVPYAATRPLHVLRHTCASLMFATGQDPVSIRDVLGHSSLTTTNRYAHSYTEDRKRAVEGIRLPGRGASARAK